MRNASNSEDERDEVYNENFSTTTQYGTAIEEVNVELYITQFIPLVKKNTYAFNPLIFFQVIFFPLLTCRTRKICQILKGTCLMLPGVKMKTIWTVKNGTAMWHYYCTEWVWGVDNSLFKAELNTT